jgi:hypothetical protein
MPSALYVRRRNAWGRGWRFKVMPSTANGCSALMRLAGLVAIYQRPNTSKPAPAHKIYPYLLGGILIERLVRRRQAAVSQQLFFQVGCECYPIGVHHNEY